MSRPEASVRDRAWDTRLRDGLQAVKTSITLASSLTLLVGAVALLAPSSARKSAPVPVRFPDPDIGVESLAARAEQLR